MPEADKLNQTFAPRAMSAWELQNQQIAELKADIASIEAAIEAGELDERKIGYAFAFARVIVMDGDVLPSIEAEAKAQAIHLKNICQKAGLDALVPSSKSNEMSSQNAAICLFGDRGMDPA